MSQDYDNTNRGALFKNDRKEKDTHPDYKGQANVNGVEVWMSAWLKEDRNGKKFMSFSFQQKDQQDSRRADPEPRRQREPERSPGQRSARPAPPPPRASSGFDDMDDDIPL